MSNIPNMPNQKDYKNLTPFDLVLIQKFPFIEEDFDAINMYGILSKIKDYLNNVIANEQIVTENQQSLYDYVDNYFKNLDVQNEINNKLDEMAESGTLNDILVNVFTTAQSIARDTLFNNIQEAFSTCLANNYILFLTQDYTINDTEGLEIPSIIGNGHTINYVGVGLVANNKNIENINFINNSESNQYAYAIKLTNGSIKNCKFNNYISPLIVTGKINSNIKNNIFENCAQGVFVNNAENVKINGISFVNTAEERINYINSLITTDGKDGILVQNSKNVFISNSYFKYCVERLLYSSDSDNVTIENCIADFCDGFKFCGYTAIRNNFNCNNNIIKNAFDDAFVQLYHCENINITNNFFNADNDSNCLGWFIRTGHHISNLNIIGNKVSRIKRAFLDYEDTFPNTIQDNDYIFSNVNIKNNYADRICLISGNHLPIINIKDENTENLITKNNINLIENTFYSRNYDSKSTWTNGNYSSSSLIYCKNASILNIKNNLVKGIFNVNNKIPTVDIDNSTQVNIEQEVFHTVSQPLINFASFNGYGKVKVNYLNEDVLNGSLIYNFNNNRIFGILDIVQFGQIFYRIPKNWNLNLDVLNTDEFEKIGIYNEVPIVSGNKISTSLGNEQNFIYFYDTDDGNITLRTRITRNLHYKGIFDFTL